MAGYVESYMHDRVARAYERVLGQFPEVSGTLPLELVPPPAGFRESVAFTPKMGLITDLLRQFFAGEDGRQAAVVLSFVKQQAFVVRQVDDAAGLVQYGVDRLGPYRLLSPKRRLFRKQEAPTLTRVSFEELCFYVDDPKQVYQTVYLLMQVAVAAVLEGER